MTMVNKVRIIAYIKYIIVPALLTVGEIDCSDCWDGKACRPQNELSVLVCSADRPVCPHRHADGEWRGGGGGKWTVAVRTSGGETSQVSKRRSRMK